ncbi:MAG TPA: MFS transporter [Noviherbaspirillum sp.]|nr:MFS transporter [Noviherbaspirillum sp.]
MFASSPLLHLIVVSLLAHMALAGSRIITSLYALSLHASELTIGILIALFSLCPMLFAMSVGRLIDRIGIIRPMLAGCMAIGIGCILPGLIGGMPVLYLATMLIGTGFMAVQIVSQHTVGAISTEEKRATNYSWLALGFSISGFFGPVIAGLLIEHATYSTAYMAFAGLPLCALVFIAFSQLKKIRLHAQPADAHSSALGLLRDVRIRRIYMVGILLASAWDLFTFVLPIHGTRSGFSASTIGLILGCFSAATFLVRLLMPWYARRYSEWQVLTSALVLAALCYVLFPLIHAPLPLMALAAMLGLAVGAGQPNILALLHLMAPAGRAAEAVGIRVTIGNACQVFLPLAFGGAGAALGLSAVFWGMGVMISAGVPMAWRQSIGK